MPRYFGVECVNGLELLGYSYKRECWRGNCASHDYTTSSDLVCSLNRRRQEFLSRGVQKFNVIWCLGVRGYQPRQSHICTIITSATRRGWGRGSQDLPPPCPSRRRRSCNFNILEKNILANKCK